MFVPEEGPQKTKLEKARAGRQSSNMERARLVKRRKKCYLAAAHSLGVFTWTLMFGGFICAMTYVTEGNPQMAVATSSADDERYQTTVYEQVERTVMNWVKQICQLRSFTIQFLVPESELNYEQENYSQLYTLWGISVSLLLTLGIYVNEKIIMLPWVATKKFEMFRRLMNLNYYFYLFLMDANLKTWFAFIANVVMFIGNGYSSWLVAVEFWEYAAECFIFPIKETPSQWKEIWDVVYAVKFNIKILRRSHLPSIEEQPEQHVFSSFWMAVESNIHESVDDDETSSTTGRCAALSARIPHLAVNKLDSTQYRRSIG